MQDIEVRYSNKLKDRGVFACKNFKKGDLIEICPIIKFRITELPDIKKTTLRYYYYEYDNDYDAIFLGYGSLYNHSYSSNARYLYDYKNETISFKAVKDIPKDSEIFVNYNYYPNSKDPLEKWFDPNFRDMSK
jgi:uncharacterized protein